MSHSNTNDKQPQSELEFYRKSQEISKIGTWHWDIAADRVTWSQNVESIFGLEPGTFGGSFQDYQALILQDDLDEVLKQIDVCLKGQQPNFNVKHRIRWPDNSIHWLEGWGGAQFDEQGKPISMAGSVVDITQQKKSEDALLQITDHTATKTGSAFLNTFVSEVAKSLDADYAFIGLYNELNHSIDTISTYVNGEIVDNFNYALEDTPCSNVMTNTTCIYPSQTQQQFPKDILLQEMGVEAYVGVPLTSEDGKVIGLLVTLYKQELQDTALHKLIMEIFAPRIHAEIDRIQVYEALESSEQRYRDLIQYAPEAIVLFDLNTGKFIEVNSAAEALFQMNADELKSIGPAQVSPELQSNGRRSEEMAKHYVSEAISGKHITFEWEHINKSNDLIYCEISLQHVPDKDRQLVRGTLVDITDRKSAHQVLLNKEENLRITLNSIADAVIATDNSFHIERMNPVAEALIGQSFDLCEGKILADIITLRFASNHEKITDYRILLQQEADNTGIRSPFILQSPYNKEVIVSCNAAPIKNVEQKEIGSVFVFRDISKQQEIEDQLRQAQKMESIGQLAGGIAHDFNNMLAGVIATSELLNLSIENAQQSKYVQGIIDTSLRAADLTQQLLTFSRKGKTESKIIDIHHSLENVLSLLQRSFDKRINIKTDLAAQNHHINGDQSQIESAIINLGVNARDAMPNGGTFSVSTTNIHYDEQYCQNSTFDIKPGEFFTITISDTGVGIDPNIISFIFEPFFTTKGVGKGTGLGLSAVYGTVCDHGGIIEVDSESGKGTTLTISLPISQSHTNDSLAKSLNIAEGNGSILIIDDEETIRKICADLLEGLGYEVETAENGQQGIDLARNNPDKFDTVLLDMIMPGINGKDVFIELRKINKDINIIITSGFTRDADVNQMLQDGAKAFIQKPFRVGELSRIIRELNN